MPKIADAIFYEDFGINEDVTGLKNGQYELGGLIFGTRTLWLVPNNYLVQKFQTTEGAATIGDVPLPNEDGIRFGVDFRGGQAITFDMALWNKGREQAYDDVSVIKGIWQHPKWRTKAGEVTTLRMNRGGRTRRVYGRPRKFQEAYGSIERGYAPITADFQCIDESFYDDLELTQTIGLANPPTAGLVLPTTAPVRIQQYAAAYTNVTIGGDKPTWPVYKIQGPVTNPAFQVDQQWTCQLLLSLNHTQWITIDTRPWRRLTLQNNTINKSGDYTATSPVMREMKIEPGLHDIVYTGIDPTLTSTLTIGWRPAWSTP